MNISWSSKIKGLATINCDRHTDSRGIYQLIFDNQVWSRSTENIDAFNAFMPYQTSYSKSKYGVLRGLHGDLKTSKLISCPHGSFQLVVVDINPGSESFRSVEVFNLDENIEQSILIPQNCANGHLITSKEAIFHYLQNTSYGYHNQFTLSYKDDSIANIWEFGPTNISSRDAEGLTLSEIANNFK